MSVREFTDSDGIAWRVIDVHPHWTERRVRHRRRHVDGAPDVPPPGDRRHVPDRRRVTQVRAPVAAGHEQGWLAFDSPNEKRRLAPVPAGWMSCPTERLEELCRAAQPVRKWKGRLIE